MKKLILALTVLALSSPASASENLCARARVAFQLGLTYWHVAYDETIRTGDPVEVVVKYRQGNGRYGRRVDVTFSLSPLLVETANQSVMTLALARDVAVEGTPHSEFTTETAFALLPGERQTWANRFSLGLQRQAFRVEISNVHACESTQD